MLLNIRKFQSISFFLILNLKPNAQEKGDNSKRGEYHHRNSIIINRLSQPLYTLSNLGFNLRALSGNTWIHAVKHIADNFGDKTKSEILYPENKRIGTSQTRSINNFWNARP